MTNELARCAVVAALVVLGSVQMAPAQQESGAAGEEPASTAQPEQDTTAATETSDSQAPPGDDRHWGDLRSPDFRLHNDDILKRKRLTGDWGGLRTELEDHGIKLDFRLQQYYQGVVSGGNRTTSEYGAVLDYLAVIDGHKLGLWQGFFVLLHAQTSFGLSINTDAGAFSLPNTSLLYPSADESNTGITMALFIQALSKNFALAAGKINVVDFYTLFRPQVGAGAEGFMNANVLAPSLPFLRWLNLSVNAVAAIALTDDKQIQGFVAVFDTHNSTTTVGLDEQWHDGAAILGAWKFFFEIDDKPAHLLAFAGGSTREYFDLEQTDTTRIPGARRGRGGLRGFDDHNGSWTIAALWDQVLWESSDPADAPTPAPLKMPVAKRNVRWFSGGSISDGDPSFAKWTVFTTLEATGLLFDRKADRAGVGAFYTALSDDFKDLLPNRDLGDLWGAEVYYSVELTPWCHWTADFQVVQSEDHGDDPAFILGMRTVIDF